MTAIERTAYPRFKQPLSRQELETLYTPLPNERTFIQETARGDTQQLAVAVLLKSFQSLGYFSTLSDVPDSIVQHIRSQSPGYPHASDMTDISSTSLYSYRAAIQDFLGVSRYEEGGEETARTAIMEAAQTMNDPADLINAAVEELVRQRFVLPAYSTLDRMAATIRQGINQGWYEMVYGRLSEADQEILARLPQRRNQATRTDFTLLKQPAGRANLSQMRLTRRRLQWLQSLMDTSRLLEDIPLTRVQQFADEARSLEAGDIASYTEPRRYTLLLCLLHEAKVRLRDELALMLIKRMKTLHAAAKKELDEIQEEQRRIQEQMTEMMAAISYAAMVTNNPMYLGHMLMEILGGNEGAEQIWRYCWGTMTYHDNNFLPLIPSKYKSYRRELFNVVDVLDIRSTSQDTEVVEALAFISNHQNGRSTHLPADISLGFTSGKWWDLVTERIDGETWYRRHALEACVFSYVAAELQTGDLYIVGSGDYADLRDDLLPWEVCEQRVEAYCEAVGLPATPADFVAHLRHWLAMTAEGVDRTFPDHSEITFKGDNPVLKRLRKRKAAPGSKVLKTALQERMPEMGVLDVLAWTNQLVNFTRHFGPLSGSDPKIADPVVRYLLTIFAYGCNMGPTQLVRHTRDPISVKALSRTHLQHITIAKLDAAIQDVINTYSRFDLPFYWGSGKAAAADGTLIDIYNNNLLSAYHVRYGRYGGVAYHHVSDTYIALFTHFIAVGVWEAVYIIDGLLHNDSEIQPDKLHADTQGQSLPVFGLAHLLGIELMPRIRQWKDLTMVRPTSSARYTHIDPLFGRTVNWELIETHWQDMMQIILSIEAGRILPSALLRRLSSYSKKNRLYRAFRELGYVIRTIFLLQYISDRPMRRQITASTNKVESYHEFSSWVAFGGDVIPTNDPLEQEKRAKYRDLVANCIILKNVIDMTPRLRQLHKEGFAVNRETIARLSPYSTDHVLRFGEYTLELDDIQVTPVEFEIGIEGVTYEEEGV